MVMTENVLFFKQSQRINGFKYYRCKEFITIYELSRSDYFLTTKDYKLTNNDMLENSFDKMLEEYLEEFNG